MVLDHWKTKLYPMIMAKEQCTPHMFLQCQWQRKPGISRYYFIYRWLLACIFTSILIASVLGLGRPPQGHHYYLKWLIYLTHWGFTLCTLQALFAAVLLTHIHLQRKHDPDITEETIKMKNSFRVYWVLHTIAVVAAFGITIIYWTFVYDPRFHKLDAVNVLVHAVNSMLMLMDLCIVSHPTRLLHFYWPLSFALSYVIFSAVYFIAGGTDRLDRTYIYNILDWRQPWKTLLIVISMLIFVIVLHMLVYLFSILRIQLVRRIAKHRVEAQIEICQTQTSVSVINIV